MWEGIVFFLSVQYLWIDNYILLHCGWVTCLVFVTFMSFLLVHTSHACMYSGAFVQQSQIFRCTSKHVHVVMGEKYHTLTDQIPWNYVIKRARDWFLTVCRPRPSVSPGLHRWLFGHYFYELLDLKKFAPSRWRPRGGIELCSWHTDDKCRRKKTLTLSIIWM